MAISRFQRLVNKLKGRKGVTDPKALAASIGRKKYGPKRFAEMAAAGRRRAARGPGGRPRDGSGPGRFRNRRAA